MHGAANYPEPRDRRDVTFPPANERAGDTIESGAPLPCLDTDVQVIRFAGAPDLIVLAAHTFPAIFTFRNEMGVELGEVTVGPGVPYNADVRAVQVLARNAIAGSNAVASALGQWRRARAG